MQNLRSCRCNPRLPSRTVGHTMARTGGPRSTTATPPQTQLGKSAKSQPTDRLTVRSTFQVLTHTCATSSRDVGLGSQHPDHAYIGSQSPVQQNQW
ncbi:hypothetical protein MTR67_044505 [Solanum verrucosum]|uniref:Uncharacterized protein n=1 Tax=Solanum verrucosum TaxID=315347 RepID=A0AAF0USB1_SOLVR|nr:hypothetical protein MTR67_044505 [Solanum verrucosum]